MAAGNNYTKTKHDVGLLRQDGTTTVGLMLAQEKGVKLYDVTDSPFLSQQYYSAEPDYSALPPEEELAIRQDNWIAGYGQEIYDGADPKRYYASYSMDLRHQGMAIAGPLPTTVTNPSKLTPTLLNGDMELNSTWNGGTQSSTQKHGGSYSWVLPTRNSTSYQDISVTIADYQGRWVSIAGWIYAQVNPYGSIGIDDGVGSTVSTSGTASAWTYRAVSHKMSASATRLRIILQSTQNGGAEDNPVYFDDLIIGQGGGSGVFCDFNGKLYTKFGNVLAKLSDTGTGFDEIGAFPNAITDLLAFTDGKRYIALGWDDAYWEMNSSEVFTVNNLSNNTMKYFTQFYGTASQCYASDGTNTIRSTPNPAAGGTAWSNQTTIGDTVHFITDLLSEENVLYIMKDNHPYYLDATLAVKYLAEKTRHLSVTNQGKNSLSADHKIFYPCGAQSLLEYDGDDGELYWRDPSLVQTNLSEFVGKVEALAADDRYLYAAVDNGTATEILAGREEAVDGTIAWRWHPLAELTLAGCETMYVSSVYKKRLWIASTSGTDSLYYLPLTTKYGNITGDTDYTFQTGGYFITPWLHAQFKGDNKSFIKLILTMADTSGTAYFEAHYQKKGDTSWTKIDDFKTSPTTTKYIPVDSGANKPVSTYMRFKFVVVTTSSATPKLLRYDCRAILFPLKRRIIKIVVRCADDIKDKESGDLGLSAGDISTILTEADDATWPITFYDIWGNTKYVKFLSPSPEAPVVKTEKDRPIEQLWTIRMVEVKLS